MRIMKKLRIDDREEIDKSGQEQSVIAHPVFDEDYINDLIVRAKQNWEGIDPDEWLQSIRGEYGV